ncbi:MAG: DUF5011 domain-containing protein [Saccharospirillaceae bacterium]|nr:DUF5011 domain-containing protein [Pseudomonadales bacterium]NRB81221.1 DUF5011 domain-containing protein [Saccharospirillaceae bacterium]
MITNFKISLFLLLTILLTSCKKEEVDLAPPVMTLIGESTISIRQYSTFVDPGVNAIDEKDGELAVIVSGTVNTDLVGSYTMVYSAQDHSGNFAANITRSVIVFDDVAPVITLNGESVIELEVGSNYQERGVHSTVYGDLDWTLTIDGTVDTSQLGSYQLTYSAQDISGNVSEPINREVTIVDASKPILSLIGFGEVNINVGDEYQELGIEIWENYDTNIQYTTSGNLDRNKVGSYELNYNATDSSGNMAQAITRIIHVIDTIPPVLTLIGDDEISFYEGGEYVELGVQVEDNHDQNITVETISYLNSNFSGQYLITYQASDSSGNESSITRLVTVLKDEAPEINLVGPSHLYLYQGGTYTELGVIAIDDIDGLLAFALADTVKSNEVGTYELTYFASDSKGQRVSVKRFVYVLPNEFITTWKTDNLGITENNQIRLEVNRNFDYDFNVDWGDGQIDENVTSEITHTYAQAGTYEVKISGQYPQNYFWANLGSYSDAYKLLSIDNWGSNKWLSMHRAFLACGNMLINAIDEPDLSLVTDMSEMFSLTHNFNQYINHWDVSNVTNMDKMFYGARAFNQQLNQWDVSQVTNMNSMFYYADTFNQDISTWDVSQVTSMRFMFKEAGLNIENYSELLIAWSNLTLQSNVMFDAGSSQYVSDSLAQIARTKIAEDFNWIINDAGSVIDGNNP